MDCCVSIEQCLRKIIIFELSVMLVEVFPRRGGGQGCCYFGIKREHDDADATDLNACPTGNSGGDCCARKCRERR